MQEPVAHDASVGRKVTDPHAVAAVEATLLDRLEMQGEQTS
jgi:hypothetical protein